MERDDAARSLQGDLRHWHPAQALARTDARDAVADELRDLQAEADLPMDQLLAAYHMAAESVEGA